MRLRFTVTAKSPQRIEVDPAEFVGMAQSEIWGRVLDRVFECAVFSADILDRDADAFIDAWRDLDRAAPKCGLCHETFRNDDEIVAGDGKRCHKRCYRA